MWGDPGKAAGWDGQRTCFHPPRRKLSDHDPFSLDRIVDSSYSNGFPLRSLAVRESLFVVGSGRIHDSFSPRCRLMGRSWITKSWSATSWMGDYHPYNYHFSLDRIAFPPGRRISPASCSSLGETLTPVEFASFVEWRRVACDPWAAASLCLAAGHSVSDRDPSPPLRVRSAASLPSPGEFLDWY